MKTQIRMKTAYGHPQTKTLEAAHKDTEGKNPFTYFDGAIYEGGVKSFSEEDTPIMSLPSFALDAAERDRTDMGPLIYSSSLKTKWAKYLQGGISDWGDISGITVIKVLDEVLSRKWRQYNLLNSIRSVPMPDLGAKLDYISTKMTGQAKVPDLVEADVEEESFTQITFDLWKNVSHIVKSDRMQKKGNHAFMDIGVEQASKALSKLKNTQIATALETATGSAGSNWGTRTTAPNNDDDPLIDITSEQDTLNAADFEADTIAFDNLVWRDYWGNTFVKQFHDQAKQTPLPDGSIQLPGIPGMNLFIDTQLTATIAVIYDSTEAFLLGQGPVEAARYRNELAGYDAYILREYLQPLKIDPAASRKLTGIR